MTSLFAIMMDWGTRADLVFNHQRRSIAYIPRTHSIISPSQKSQNGVLMKVLESVVHTGMYGSWYVHHLEDWNLGLV